MYPAGQREYPDVAVPARDGRVDPVNKSPLTFAGERTRERTRASERTASARTQRPPSASWPLVACPSTIPFASGNSVYSSRRLRGKNDSLNDLG